MSNLKKAYQKCHRGKYRPKNPGKYNGDIRKINYRSGLELSAFRWFDRHPSVLSWSSENIIVPYYYQRSRRYIVDIWARIKQDGGEIKQFLIEIKHSNKLKRPKAGKRRSKYYDALVEEYNINQAKWCEAKKYAINHGMEFKILTERIVQR